MSESFKETDGKLRLSLVPTEVIRAIARVREFGVKKYGENGAKGWREVPSQAFRDAMFRHMLLYLEDPYGVDRESGLKHLEHLACNVAFLLELEKDNGDHRNQVKWPHTDV